MPKPSTPPARPAGAQPDAPGSLPTLRAGNRARVLAAVRARGTASRAQIAADTGLSRTTVSGLVGELVGERLLRERDERAPAVGSGRPATLLSLDTGGLLLGTHFAHDGVRTVLADADGAVLDESFTALDMDSRPAAALSTAVRAMKAFRKSASRPCLGVGVALSGPVRGGRPLSTGGLLPQWAEVDVAAALEDRLGLPTRVGNDANLGAAAEWAWGAGQGASHVIYVMLADGVGAGLMLGGVPYTGAGGVAGELGHVVVEPGGYVCRCGGRGCLETVVGGPALVAALSRTHGPSLTLPDVVELVAAGDGGAVRVVEDAGRAVGRALAGACAVLDVERVVVGGTVAGAGEPLLAGIRQTLLRGLSPVVSPAVHVVAGSLGARAEVLGAVSLVARSATMVNGSG